MTKQIAVLGSTGSIGTRTLDIIESAPGRYHADLLVAGHRVDDLITQALRHRPRMAIIADESLYGRLREALEPAGIAVAAGSKAIAEQMSHPAIDMVVTATVGYSGLEPTVAAIKAGKDIALANKETMVVAGSYITSLLADSSSRIFPVDSEHSAIYQCLQGERAADVRRLIITASGGPFRTWSHGAIQRATPADALRHPNWSMGAKITIDSATMVNKAFEIIEARWLFDIAPERISPIVHPQSIIHSMVEFADGAIKAQMGVPDMGLPIAYALGEATRLPEVSKNCNLLEIGSLTFEEPDVDKFPCLTLASTALQRGGNAACVINAANEIAVGAFLDGRLTFTNIFPLITKTLEKVPFIENPAYEDFVATNVEARAKATELINTL